VRHAGGGQRKRAGAGDLGADELSRTPMPFWPDSPVSAVGDRRIRSAGSKTIPIGSDRGCKAGRSKNTQLISFGGDPVGCHASNHSGQSVVLTKEQT
jgi:hypothetical protein